MTPLSSILLTALALSLVVGCEQPREGAVSSGLFAGSTADERNALEVQLSDAEEQWVAAGANYRMVIDHWNIGQVSRAELVVAGDSILSVTALPNDRGELPMHPASLFPTISDLFEQARSAIREAYGVEVKFDPELGYPTYLQVDYSAGIRDDEMWVAVRELELRTR